MVDVDEMRWTWWCSEGRSGSKRSVVPLSANHNMEESIIPSLSAGVVGSRFITQDEVETVKLRREEQWKAAYARLVVPFPFRPRRRSFSQTRSGTSSTTPRRCI